MLEEKFFLQDFHMEKLLNSVGENLIIANNEYEVIWMNDQAKELLKLIGPYLNKPNPEDFIGLHLFSFHGEKQQNIIKFGPFPHRAQIKLFNRFSADLLIDKMVNKNNEEIGYIVTWKDVTKMESERVEVKKQLQTLYTPIISTALNEVMFVVLAGILSEERLLHTQEKVLHACTDSETEFVIFNFTGINQVVDENIAFLLNQIAASLKLVGVEPIYTGLNADVVKQIVLKGFHLEINSFLSFQQGINYVWKKLGYELVKM